MSFPHTCRTLTQRCLSDPNYVFSIDGHSMTIIEADSVNTNPLTVDSLQIFSAQRYSVVVHANQTIGNYWVLQFSLLIGNCVYIFPHRFARIPMSVLRVSTGASILPFFAMSALQLLASPPRYHCRSTPLSRPTFILSDIPQFQENRTQVVPTSIST